MNDRILELAQQAGFDIEALKMYPGGWPREDLLVLEDFAQLIMKECISACATDQLGKTASAEELIKRHFGVTE
jgi:hypothetical protein